MGLQVPSLVDQYSKRVDAHYNEASQNLAGFQTTADRYFNSSIEKLIEHYSNSEDAVFRQDADNIQSIYQRVSLYQAEKEALSQGAFFAAMHVLFQSDNLLMDETLNQYSYAILLNPQALVWGLLSAFLLAVLVESLLRGLLRLCVPQKREVQ